MLESFPFVLLLSTLLGFLTGLGIGGGSLLILWLTMVLDMDQDTARSINLLFFLPSALISSLFRLKQGQWKLKTSFPAMAAGCLSAVLFSCLRFSWDSAILKKAFGILLLATGIRELLYKEKK